MKYVCLVLFIVLATGMVKAQDTSRYTHSFRLPVTNSSTGYEKEISQYSSHIHSFIFKVYDSCTLYIVIRSQCDSLDIRLDNRFIEMASKQDGFFVYSEVIQAGQGEKVIVIRAPRYCTYSFYAKGQQ
jgi:hypothetical protein